MDWGLKYVKLPDQETKTISQKRVPETKSHYDIIPIDLLTHKTEGLRIDKKAYLWVGDLKQIGHKVDYDQDRDIVTVR